VKLATIRTSQGTRAARLDGDKLVELGAPDVGTLLKEDGLKAARTQSGSFHDLATANFAPVVPRPSKIICVGHNYTGHIREMGRELPPYPTLFTKFADSLIGADDPIVKPPETEALDWEAELVVVLGRPVRRADEATAAEAIAGFTVMNDVSMRDWQFRTVEWTQGKVWDSSTPVGPFMATPEEVGGVNPSLAITTSVDGALMQKDDTGTLLFDPVFLVQYISTIVRLEPGDLIATGTPAGVGHARDPRVYLEPGQTVVTSIESIGSLRNVVVDQ
jgi:acylpyruvate hydrolase